MNKEGKIILSIIIGTIIFIGGLAFLMTKGAGGSGGDRFIPNVEASSLEENPPGSMDIGQVPYGGGKVTKSFDVKNTSDKTIKLRKITTSCMCTTAKFLVGGKESKFYGMEMNGDLNPLIDVDFPAGATGKVIFEFDPAAHGPQGIGSFERVVTLFFDSGYKDFEFNGTVVN
jgi:hypothetical protein